MELGFRLICESTQIFSEGTFSQSVLAAKLQIAGFDISRSGVSKIEARLSYVDDKTLLYLAEVLKVQLQELFPTRPPGNRIYDFIEKLETTRF